MIARKLNLLTTLLILFVVLSFFSQAFGRVVIKKVGDRQLALKSETSEDSLELPFEQLEGIVYDTIATGCISLSVANNGNVGHEGIGGVNLDWYDAGDCDETADIYLFDGSPLIGWVNGVDTIVNSSMWYASYLSNQRLIPLSTATATAVCSDITVFESNTLVSYDSSLALERIWFTPNDGTDGCDFVIEYLRLWSYDGEIHSDVFVGEGVDWDIPDDSDLATNTAGMSPFDGLFYQSGAEYYDDDATYPYNCQYNNARFGGVAFIESYWNGAIYQSYPYSAIVEEYDSLAADDGYGFNTGRLYEAVSNLGFRTTTAVADLHTILCYEFGLRLGPTDVYEAFTVLATVRNGSVTDLEDAADRARSWFISRGGHALVNDLDLDGDVDICYVPVETCCDGPRRGDIDYSGGYPLEIDIVDLVYLVNYMFAQGVEPPCTDEADVCGDGGVDIQDLVSLVNFMFPNGSEIYEPAVCPQ